MILWKSGCDLVTERKGNPRPRIPSNLAEMNGRPAHGRRVEQKLRRNVTIKPNETFIFDVSDLSFFRTSRKESIVGRFGRSNPDPTWYVSCLCECLPSDTDLANTDSVKGEKSCDKTIAVVDRSLDMTW